MLFNKTALPEKRSGVDPVYFYTSAVALLIFLYVVLEDYSAYLYDQLLIVPCALCLGSMLSRKITPAAKKCLCLSLLMVLWFTFLQVKRTFENGNTYSFGLFFSTYLFAFPLASLTQDGEQKKYLKLFASVFIAATLCLSGYGILLLLDLLPPFLAEDIYWDGARLLTFCHPNILACFLMIGIIFCSAFFSQAKIRWHKIFLFALLLLLLGTMALTNCRSVILLTSMYFSSSVFFAMIKRGRRWFLPSIAVTIALTLVVFSGFGKLFQYHQNVLLAKFTNQYYDQLVESVPQTTLPEEETSSQSIPDSAAEVPDEEYTDFSDKESADNAASGKESSIGDTSDGVNGENYEDDDEEYAESEEETLPVYIDPNTGEVSLKVESPQNSFINDLYTLNSRTHIWNAARFAIRENPSILICGVDTPGHYVSYYNFFYSAHTHNSWIECLMGLGLPGFLMAMLFTLFAVWNSLVILLKHYQDVWKRRIALLTLCLLVASVIQPYLFYTTIYYHPVDFTFFLCVGYLVHWQEEDNRNILSAVRKFLHMK